MNDQLDLPFTFEPPDPGPRPDKRKAVPVSRKPAEREVLSDAETRPGKERAS